MLGRPLIFLVLLPLAGQLSAFEIRPVGCAGAVGHDVNASDLVYEDAVRHCSGHEIPIRCTQTRVYALQVMGNKPIHEVITRQAYEAVYSDVANGKPWLDPQNWRSSAISGVVWNDDPQYLLRKAAFVHGGTPYSAIPYLLRLRRVLAEGEANPDSRMMNVRSHYGDLQFLHAMQSRGLTQELTLVRLHKWVHAVHDLVLDEIGPATPVSTTRFSAALGNGECGLEDASKCTVERLLDIEGRFRSDPDWSCKQKTQAVKDLAVGTVLHIVQDAHSTSHTELVEDAERAPLRKLKTYDTANQMNHCHADRATPATQASIAAALEASKQYLRLVREKAPWCAVKLWLESLGLPDPTSPRGHCSPHHLPTSGSRGPTPQR